MDLLYGPTVRKLPPTREEAAVWGQTTGGPQFAPQANERRIDASPASAPNSCRFPQKEFQATQDERVATVCPGQ